VTEPDEDTPTVPIPRVSELVPSSVGSPSATGDPSRPTRRQTIIGVTAAGLAIVIAIVVGVLGAAWSGHRDLVRDYEAAAAKLSEARLAYEQADAELAESRGAVRGIAALIDPIAAMVGEPIPVAATEALVAARDEATVSVAPPPPPASYEVLPDEHPDALSDEALRAEAPRLTDAAERLGTATAYRARLASGAAALAAGLGTAFVEYTDAVAARGAELIAERADASAESRMALQSAIDALPGAETEDVEEIVASAVAAAADVIASSNRVRIDDAASITVVVNKHRPLNPIDYAPELVWADVPYGWEPEFRPEAAAALEEMFAAFEAETGEQLLAQSNYRSYDDQVFTYNSCIENLGYTQAERACARPGHSEHQTGLTADVAAVGWGCLIQECFGDTMPGQWLAENSWKYGFIVRYPDGYEHITGFAYEPWHMRYTGVEVTTDMHERGIMTLEEYYGLEPAPDYP